MAGSKLSEKSDTEDDEEEEYIKIFDPSIDLVTAGRRQVSFLQRVFESQWFHHPPSIIQSIRRYDELWMPLISDLSINSKTSPMILPPLDIQWAWFCHTLNPITYREYCQSKFSRLIEKSLIFNDENQEYASNRCRDIWSFKYPDEPFDIIESTTTSDESITVDKSILDEVMKQRFLYTKFSKPYMIELVYLIASRKRYARFLYLLHKFKEDCSKLIPTLDIQLMWLTHQSYPVVYARDMKNIEDDLSRVNGIWDKANDEDMKMTRKLWERLFDQPYEKAGGMLDEIVRSIKIPVYWDAWCSDVNAKYKSLEPRFLLEVYVSMRADREIKERQETCLRLRTVRCHRELKISKPTISVQSDSWDKMWYLCCEFGTRGIMLELGQQSGAGGGAKSSCCKKKTSLKSTLVFLWYDLLRAPSLTLEKELQQKWMRAVASITPPAQAPYLLKCVPDCVTDDSGAMISDVILKMNLYRPQDGRWLSRTVLDHAGRECFVLRIRMGSGFWRRVGDVPVAVKKEERIIEVREGSWRYVAGSIGRTPDKVVGSATPKVEEGSSSGLESSTKTCSWSLSNGYELVVQWDSSSSAGLTFHLSNPSTSQDSSVVRLLKGRKMQYQVVDNNDHEQVVSDKSGNKQEDDEEAFVTMVRYTEEYPNGKATALMNWKLLVVEVTPEEDAVAVLLLCMAILRSITEMKREDVGGLLIRRRLKQTQLGLRDWGSVFLPVPNSKSNSPTNLSSSSSSPHLKPWYWNPKVVMASSIESDYHHKTVRQPSGYHYTEAEGGDKLYKKGLLIVP